MKTSNYFLIKFFVTSVSLYCSALYAQENTVAPAAQQEPPQVVFPRPEEVVEESINEIEDVQLTPDQWDKIKQIILDREAAKASPYISQATPITRTLPVSLDPGVTPPTIRLSRGQLSTIVFSDFNGQPWFIDNVSINRGLFCDGKGCSPQGQQGGGQGAPATATGKEPPTNILTLEPMTIAAFGNVSVTLRGLSTPVIFILTTGQQEVDMRVDAKIPGRNPDAADVVSLTNLPSIDAALTYFLDGVPPSDAKLLKVSGLENAQAWLYKNSMYLRADASAQYPAYIDAARSTSGLSVYRYASFHQTVTLLRGGKALTIFIEQK